MSLSVLSDDHFMKLAYQEAEKAFKKDEVPVGAVIVLDDSLVASGFNLPIANHDPTAHAEIQAIRQAANVLENYRLLGVTLYVTLEPCVMCLGAMLHARIDRLVFGV